MGEQKQDEADIRLKRTRKKYAMQLKLEHKSMGAPWENKHNNIEKNMRFQRNVLAGLTRLPILRKHLAWAPKYKARCSLGCP
jgi:hypothetical protein